MQGRSVTHYICPHLFMPLQCPQRKGRSTDRDEHRPKRLLSYLFAGVSAGRCPLPYQWATTPHSQRVVPSFSCYPIAYAAMPLLMMGATHPHPNAACLSVVRLTYCSSLFCILAAHSFFRELISAEVLRTCSMKSSLVSVVLFSIAAASIDGRQRSVAFALPTCDSERPNSWATFRTLSIPNVPEFLGINNDDASSRWARALCCIYTHVEKSDRLSQPQMKTYDGSKYNIRADSFVEAARKAMDDICDMSMGSDDCRRRKQCVDEALTQGSQDIEPNDKVVSTVATACEDDSSFARGNKTCRFISIIAMSNVEEGYVEGFDIG